MTVRYKRKKNRTAIRSDKSVWELSLERTHRIYDLFDNVAVSFSGGKDSTAVLNVTLEVAREREALPLDVVFYDEEVCAPETIDYVRRVANRDDVNMTWLALPVMHRNSCSTREPYWYPWAPEAEALWVREMPPEAITTTKGFRRAPIGDHSPDYLADKYNGTVALLLGIRADESLIRRQGVSGRREDNFITGTTNPLVNFGKPVYDWRTADVWTAPKLYGWDYNKSYDLMDKAGIKPPSQRVAPPFGEQPMASLWMWAQCWPELWDKMIDRVDGAAAAARYARTQVYGAGGKSRPPRGMSWEQGIAYYLAKHPPNIQTWAARRIRQFIHTHFRDSSDPIPETTAHPKTGLSWTLLLKVARQGDLKSRTDPRRRVPSKTA